MGAFFALVRKQLFETRWLLIILGASLFLISWLTVFTTGQIERDLKKDPSLQTQIRGRGFLRGMGGPAMDYSTLAIELAFWNHPFLILTYVLWPISRGSAAVGGEIEKGSLDLVLSRPISRTSYLLSQILVMGIGLIVLALALVAGNVMSCQFNVVETKSTIGTLVDPTLNLIALALAIYGFTIFMSAVDIVRWRATTVGSILALGSYILHMVANVPSLEKWKWLDKFSIFDAYDPVAAYTKGGQALQFNVAVLVAICVVGSALSLIAFSYRDLPSNS